jgi:hypothetical protein
MLKFQYVLTVIYITLFFTFFFTRCSKDEEKIIPEEKFIEILSDIMIIDNLSIAQNDKIALMVRVFEKYDVSQKQFLLTREHYKKDADFWIRVYKRTQNRIKEKDTL